MKAEQEDSAIKTMREAIELRQTQIRMYRKGIRIYMKAKKVANRHKVGGEECWLLKEDGGCKKSPDGKTCRCLRDSGSCPGGEGR